MYLVVAFLVYLFGTNWIDRLLPPVVVGPVVMIIGLSLARAAAVKSAGLFKEVIKDGQILEVAVNVIKVLFAGFLSLHYLLPCLALFTLKDF